MNYNDLFPIKEPRFKVYFDANQKAVGVCSQVYLGNPAMDYVGDYYAAEGFDDLPLDYWGKTASELRQHERDLAKGQFENNHQLG